MFSIFVYTFCAAVSLWTSWFFYRAWRRKNYPSYREFCAFFFVLGMGFAMYLVSPVLATPAAGVVAEAGLLLILLSFAIVLRVWVRFERLSISPNIVSAFIIVLIGWKFIGQALAGLLPEPLKTVFTGWYYPLADSLAFGVLIFIFSFAFALTLIVHVKNIKKHAASILFLGLAFFVGGLSGVLIPNVSNIGMLFLGYILLVSAFVFVSLFVLSSEKQK